MLGESNQIDEYSNFFDIKTIRIPKTRCKKSVFYLCFIRFEKMCFDHRKSKINSVLYDKYY